MTGRIRSVTAYRRETLGHGWEIASSSPGSTPPLQWQPIESPGTVASALRTAGHWNLDGATRDFDAEDWWYRVRFNASPAAPGEQTLLGFDGLATLADVWLNGHALLSSDNMFVSHEIPVDAWLKGENELTIRFRSLSAALKARRPRPRWRAPMIEQQQLRWFRTTLLGRTPGWSLPAAPVGPWKPVWLERRSSVSIEEVSLRTAVQGTTGTVEVECRTAKANSVNLIVSRGGQKYSAMLTRKPNTDIFAGRLEIPAVSLWWPHTHGEPALYEARLVADSTEADLGKIGFRTIELDNANGNFALKINGTPIFCRGACWTPLDTVSFQSDERTLEAAIKQVADAGMNMLRIGGTMVYESDAFYDACDTHGILLWQEFMFANMEYPQDTAFDTSVREEVRQILCRLSGRPSLTILCGNSEGEQQAAMWGAPRELWNQPLFATLIPELTTALAPGIPYWPSSAHGGAFPHQSNTGTASYYGVGAYRRPLSDARLSGLRFASESLGFANVPEESTLAAMPRGLGLKVHHPQWKARTPRDLGAGWDFEDIRDHYLAELFELDPLSLRYSDHNRYLELSRVVTGEVMAAAFREWRREDSTCNGALVWFLRDLWPGAGWGIVDSLGLPKAPYYFLQRVLQPQAVLFNDEGVNGLFVQVRNETSQTLNGHLEIALIRAGDIPVGKARQAVSIPARGALEIPASALFEGFMDLTHAYRFGPPVCEVAAAVLTNEQGDTTIARDFHFPAGLAFAAEPDVGLTATARPLPDGSFMLSIQTKRFARYVTLHAEGFDADDQYFHVAPGAQHQVRLRPRSAGAALKGEIRASNSVSGCKIALAT